MAGGLPASDYWRHTPWMVRLCLHAAAVRGVREQNALALQAWHIHCMQGRRHFPRQMLAREPRWAPQTWREQMDICRAIAAAYGGLQ